MTFANYAETILSHCQPLAPQATGLEPRLTKLPGIRAVLFDVYGTLLISASGDIGADQGDHRHAAIEQTVALFSLKLNRPAAAAIGCFQDEIVNAHTRARSFGIEYPEVDIVDIWQTVLPQIVTAGFNELDNQRFAVEYEVRVNPTWPMPGVESTLSQLGARQLVLGIVSNAQFFTPLLFPAFFGKSLKALGFLPELSYFSYEHRQAKPGNTLYRLAQRQLETLGIEPAEVLFVGNDMLNDVLAADSVGFRTALFAGDRRSLRMRAEVESVQSVVPDVIIAELSQLTECLANSTLP